MMSDDFSTLRRSGETSNDEKLPFERISNPLPSHSSPFLVHQPGSSTLDSGESIKTSRKESVKFDNDEKRSSLSPPLTILDDPGTAAQKQPLTRKGFSGRRNGSKRKKEGEDGENERGNHGDDSLINAASVIVDDPSYHLHNDLYHLKGDPYSTNSRMRETGQNEKNEKATIIPITSTTSSSRNFLQQLSSSQSSPLLPRTTLSASSPSSLSSSPSSLSSSSSPEEAQKLLFNPIINSNNNSTIYDGINFQQNQKSIHPMNQDRIVKDSDLSVKGLNHNNHDLNHDLNPVPTEEHHSPGSEIRAPKLVPMVGYVIRSSSNHNNRDLTHHHSYRDEVMNNNNNDNDDLELDDLELSSQTTDPSINSMNKGTTSSSTPPSLTCSPSFMDGDSCHHQKHNPPSSSSPSPSSSTVSSSSTFVSSTFVSSTPHPSSLSSSSEDDIVSSEKS